MPSFTHWSAHLTQAWLHKGFLARLLWPLGVLYGGLMWARTRAYRQGWCQINRCAVPVVVVGNVVVGGAGKTPVVIQVVEHLQQRGHVPGVISRGYGRQTSGQPDAPLAVQRESEASEVGDEPLLIHRRTGVPVFVARNRFSAAQALLATHPRTTVIVCDDGLQHLALHADISVAVFDERGVGNGWLLPAGLLREPWPHGTGRPVDLTLHALPHDTSAQQPSLRPASSDQRVFTAIKTLATHAYNPQGVRQPLTELATVPGTALAGIAKPEVFFSMLRSQGVPLTHTWTLPDHQAPDEELRSNLLNTVKRWNIFLTEKDAVKLFPTWRADDLEGRTRHADDNTNLPPTEPQFNLWAVPLTLHIEPAFFTALDAKLSSPHGHQTA